MPKGVGRLKTRKGSRLGAQRLAQEQGRHWGQQQREKVRGLKGKQAKAETGDGEEEEEEVEEEAEEEQKKEEEEEGEGARAKGDKRGQEEGEEGAEADGEGPGEDRYQSKEKAVAEGKEASDKAEEEDGKDSSEQEAGQDTEEETPTASKGGRTQGVLPRKAKGRRQRGRGDGGERSSHRKASQACLRGSRTAQATLTLSPQDSSAAQGDAEEAAGKVMAAPAALKKGSPASRLRGPRGKSAAKHGQGKGHGAEQTAPGWRQSRGGDF